MEEGLKSGRMKIGGVTVKYKTAADIDKETTEAAEALPIFKKRAFWRAMTKDMKNMGEARKIAGIDDTMVAAKLVIMLHDTVYLPKDLDDVI